MANEKPRRVKIVVSAVIPPGADGKRVPQRVIRENVMHCLAQYEPKAVRIDELSSVPQKAKTVAKKIVGAARKAVKR